MEAIKGKSSNQPDRPDRPAGHRISGVFQIQMKKFLTLILTAALAASVTACSGGQTPGQDTNASSATPVSSASSGTSATSGASASSDAAVGVQVKADSMPEQTYQSVSMAKSSKAEAAKNSGTYRVKDVNYSYQKNNMVYKASYPQLSGSSGGYDAVNAALKSGALKTIDSLGTAAKKERTTVRSGGDVTYEGRDFISVGFNEFVTLSPKAETTHVLRTVNYDLKNKKAVTCSDLIVKNDAFYKALAKAAGSQLNAKLATAATADAIKKGLNPDAVFFTDSSVGFSLQLPGDTSLLKLFLSFSEAKPFMTKNAVWSNFV